MRYFHNIRTLYTPRGKTALRGRESMRAVQTIEKAAILVGEDGIVVAVGKEEEMHSRITARTSAYADHERIDCRGLVALPGFVDSHTHAVFYSERSNEFAMRAAGKSYQEIAATGGGIRSSVRQVRSASLEEIAAYSEKYVGSALGLGTTTMEIKSGYGLTVEDEVKLLRAAKLLGERTPMEIHTTFLGAHAVPSDRTQSEYVRQIIEEQLPAVAKENLAEFCDVFCDEGYFTKEETEQICKRAKHYGLNIRLHADELAETGGAALAVQLDAYSADHLLKVSEAGIKALAGSGRTVATLLPITALSLRAEYAPARKLIESGAAVAIATDCNPGSAMSENMQFAMTLAVIGMQMSVEEALAAATLNGAAALGLEKTHGSLEPGKIADVVLYDIPQLAYLPYHIAVSNVVSVFKRGVHVAGEKL